MSFIEVVAEDGVMALGHDPDKSGSTDKKSVEPVAWLAKSMEILQWPKLE